MMKQNTEKGYWDIITYTAGKVEEKIKCWMPGVRPPRSERRRVANIKKRLQNEQNSSRKLARYLNANFNKTGWLIGLDYSPSGMKRIRARSKKIQETRKKNGESNDSAVDERELCEYLAAGQELSNFLKRVRRECNKQGIVFKYIAVTSDRDGRAKEKVRVHHHLVVNADVMEICKTKWTLGGFDYKNLHNEPDYTPLAVYLVEQVRWILNANAYTSSQNLIRPAAKVGEGRNGSELRIPRGAELLHRSEYQPGRAQYIRYVRATARLE